MKKLFFCLVIFIGVKVLHGQTTSLPDTLNKIVFEKKDNPKRHYEIATPAYCSIKQIHGKRIKGYIFKANDSILTVRIFNYHKFNDAAEGRKIMRDKSLSKKERLKKRIEYFYDDSIKIPFSSIHHITFSETRFTKKFFIGIGENILAAVVFIMVNKAVPANNQPWFFLVEMDALITTDYFFMTKRINPKKWNLEK